MSKPKKLRLIIQWRVEEDDPDIAFHESKSYASERYIVLGNSSQKDIEEKLERKVKRLAKKARMTFVNGWAIDDNDGELQCGYCGYKTEGFDFGVCNSLKEKINPFDEPCSCRSAPSPSEDS